MPGSGRSASSCSSSSMRWRVASPWATARARRGRARSARASPRSSGIPGGGERVAARSRQVVRQDAGGRVGMLPVGQRFGGLDGLIDPAEEDQGPGTTLDVVRIAGRPGEEPIPELQGPSQLHDGAGAGPGPGGCGRGRHRNSARSRA